MSDLGTVLRDELGMRLEFERHYPDPVTDVWSAVVDADRMARWLGRWTGDPASGTVSFTMTGDAMQGEVQILDCTPPHRLELVLASPDGPWPLSLELTDTGGGTTLRFVHRLAEPYDATGVGPGWHYYLDRLEASLHGHEVPADFDSYSALAESYGLPA